MTMLNRSKRNRSVRPVLQSLEGRELLNAAMPHHVHDVRVPAHVFDVKHHNNQKATGPSITVLNQVSNGGFHFTNFNGPNAGTNAAAGTNMNGISNSGTAVGFDIDNNGNFHNFTVNPLKSRTANDLNINGSTTAMAFGVNSSGTVVGTDGNGNAFYSSKGKVKTFIPTGGMSATAFGINDHGTIVGQYVTSTATPGFIRVNRQVDHHDQCPVRAEHRQRPGHQQPGPGRRVLCRHGRPGPRLHGKREVRAEWDAHRHPDRGPDHPDRRRASPAPRSCSRRSSGSTTRASPWATTATPPPASTASSTTPIPGVYTFLDDPSEAFNNGVEVTQITGITNSGEITGFYSDANGVFHGFVAKA